MTINQIIAIITGFVGVVFLARVVIDYREKRLLEKRLTQETTSKTVGTSIIDSLLRPIFRLYAPAFKSLKLPKIRAWLNTHFIKAAIRHFTAEEFWAFQCLMVLLFLGFVKILQYEFTLLDSELSITPTQYAIIALLGFFFPVMWLKSTIKARQTEIVFDFPGFVDKLTLSVEAGLDFMAAMVRISQKMYPSPLREELQQLVSEVQLGSSRSQALRDFSQRIALKDVSIFTSTLIQADRLGTPIGQVLRVQSERLRRERFENAERKGAIASQKLLFPLVFFIMPAVFIVVFGPILVKFVTDGFKGLGF